jgi:hypothetical protein
MSPPPKKKRGLCRTAPHTIKLRLEYRTAALLARLFEMPFWFFAQRKAQLQDRIHNRSYE